MREEDAMTGGARKVTGWLWVGAFYLFVLVAGVALVGGGTVLAAFGLGMLRSDAFWHLIAGIALMVAGVAAFVGGLVLLFRITDIPVPGRGPADNAEARPAEYYGYTEGGVVTHGGHGHHHGGGGGHDGGGGAGN
jgi:hypothetical protein